LGGPDLIKPPKSQRLPDIVTVAQVQQIVAAILQAVDAVDGVLLGLVGEISAIVKTWIRPSAAPQCSGLREPIAPW
jgi:hypothetical protein